MNDVYITDIINDLKIIENLLKYLEGDSEISIRAAKSDGEGFLTGFTNKHRVYQAVKGAARAEAYQLKEELKRALDISEGLRECQEQ